MANILVGSVKDNIPGEYMGRRMPGRGGSVLGNPFKITKESARAASVALYEKWLAEQLAIEKSPQNLEIDRLAGIVKREGSLTLLCWCRSVNDTSPACHCDVIKRVIEERLG